MDVALYAGVLASGIYLLSRTASGRRHRSLDPAPSPCCWASGRCWASATRSPSSPRGRRCTAFLLVSLFPAHNLIVGWQFVFFFIWWGAAASKLNRHFPYVI